MTWFRTCSRIAVVSALSLGTLPLGGAAGADGPRTETKLAGFAVEVQASPLLVLLDDPRLEIPRPTGSAVVEADPNYTQAKVGAGPTALGIASTFWPGNLLGNGLAQLAPFGPYPVQAASRYPDKPYSATGPDGGVVTKSSAEGLDAFASAKGNPGDLPSQLGFGSATSTSKATVDDKDRAVGTAFSAIQDVELLGGVITIDSVTTRLETSADGTTPAGTGRTTVSGFRIADQPFSVDDTGLHAGPQSSPLPPLVTPADLAKAGITVSGIAQSTTKTASGIKREAAGLVITLETAPLRASLTPVTGPVTGALTGALGPFISRLPQEVQGQFFYLLKATPKITFVFGAARSASAATLPITFSFPPLTGFPTGPVGGGTGGGLGVGEGPLGGGSVPPALDSAPPSVVSPAAPQPVLSGPTSNADSTTEGFTGIGGGLTMAALAGSALIGWGLVRFLGLAGGVLGLGCRLGAPTSVPDLRSVTA